MFALLALCPVAFALAPQAPQAPQKRLRTLFDAVEPDSLFVDPRTKAPLKVKARFVGDRVVRTWSSGAGEEFGERSQTFVDLVEPKQPPSFDVVEAARAFFAKSQAERVQVDTFRSPLTAFLYERGWRDSFKRSGFPGIDSEFEEVRDFFGGALTELGVVVDLSCGSGLMARRLAGAAGASTRLLAADYSEAMLLETARRFRGDGDLKMPELVRVDVGALPFATGAVDAIHAGAALHCWPRLEAGLAEVQRSLRKDGGKFFATTFLTGALGSEQLGASYEGFRFFQLDELERLMRDAGFTDVQVRREGSYCAVIRCAVEAQTEATA
ncbi:S-adenosyl-L-methionine-dependent methyltransferase [Pelagophyceae sp. CCMP2097]|nr:S-adenosyl-L-methionine-dependent methyltransferase [Pelagophyceae sp. CCMP2097]